MIEASDRERHIILKALAVAISAHDSAPPEQQSPSDREDMMRIFEGLAPNDGEQAIYYYAAGWLLHGKYPGPPEAEAWAREQDEIMRQRRERGEDGG